MQWPKVFAVWHKEETVRAASRSGGIFTALSDLVLNENGVIYGCVLTSNFQAVHARADNKETRNLMRGSKYVQSRLGDIFKNVEADLNDGYKVLFSGTSCQVAGLRKYLETCRVDCNRLVCVDIVCHSVPSPKVWKEYLHWQEHRNKAKITKIDFRNKIDFGWRDHVETLTLDNGRKVDSRVFTTLFYGHSILRPCCYKCPYKSVMHPGDITIADYWGVEKAAAEFDDNKGVSLVLVNNEIGKKVFDSVKNSIKWKETKLEDSMQPPLKAPFPEPEEREMFWNDFLNKNFDYVAKKYGGAGIVNKLKRGLRKIKRKLIG